MMRLNLPIISIARISKKVISDMLHANEDIENRGMSQPGLNLFAKLIGHRMNINAESFSKNCILKTNFYSNLPEVSC